MLGVPGNLPEGAQERRVSLKLVDSRLTGREPVEYLATMTATGTTITKITAVDTVDAAVNSTTRAWKAVIIAGAPLESEGDIAVTGNQDAIRMLVDATKL